MCNEILPLSFFGTRRTSSRFLERDEVTKVAGRSDKTGTRRSDKWNGKTIPH
jgi:hypothetical protein